MYLSNISVRNVSIPLSIRTLRRSSSNVYKLPLNITTSGQSPQCIESWRSYGACSITRSRIVSWPVIRSTLEQADRSFNAKLKPGACRPDKPTIDASDRRYAVSFDSGDAPNPIGESVQFADIIGGSGAR